MSVIAIDVGFIHTVILQNVSVTLSVGVIVQFPSFQNNAIEEEGAQALAEVLQCNRKLVSLK